MDQAKSAVPWLILLPAAVVGIVMVEDAGNIDGVEAIALKLPPEPMPENPDPDPDPEGMKVPPIPDELDDPDNPDDELGPPKKLDADADDIVVVVEN